MIQSARTSQQPPALAASQVRVGLVSFRYWPGVGGAEARMEKHASALADSGHEVFVMTLRHQRAWPAEEMRHGMLVMRVGSFFRAGGTLAIGRLGIWIASLAMLRCLWRLRRRYDVLHVGQVSALAAAAAFVGALARKPVVISMQNAGPEPDVVASLQRDACLLAGGLPAADYLRVDTRHMLAHLDDVTALRRTVLGGSLLVWYLRRSHAHFQALSTREQSRLLAQGFDRARVTVIPGSVDTRKFTPRSESGAGKGDGQQVVICSARLEYNKGIDVLLHAWQQVLTRFSASVGTPMPQLRIAGEGALLSSLRYLARDLGITDHVEFCGLRGDVLELLRESSAFVLPSRWEGMPNALLEAMACGLPCVATRVSGSEDIIRDGENGLLVESGQPEPLAEALYRMLVDRPFAAQLGHAARETVANGYRVDQAVEQCVALYGRLIGMSGTRSGEARPQPLTPFEEKQ